MKLSKLTRTKKPRILSREKIHSNVSFKGVTLASVWRIDCEGPRGRSRETRGYCINPGQEVMVAWARVGVIEMMRNS